MSARITPLPAQSPSPSRPRLEIVKSAVADRSLKGLRVAFWILGLLLALGQAWAYRYATSTDSIAYLDMSDGVMRGGDWHRLINGTWSPLYPVLVGVFRRLFNIQPGGEIVAVHLLNIAIFAIAFLSFEFFLRALLLRRDQTFAAGHRDGSLLLPQWTIVAFAYSLFLWGAIAGISLDLLRPDMLMSCFLYLAVGMLLDLAGRAARWADYLLLGSLLGFAYLAKAAMLPIGALALMISLVVVKNRRAALKMTAVAGGLVLLIGSAYFVPLSLARGRVTLGESGAYNYLMHVDRTRLASWYPVNPVNSPEVLRQPATQIFSSPPAFAFKSGPFSTYPLRYEPSRWLEGLNPKFSLSRQLRATYANFVDFRDSAHPPLLLVLALIALAFFVPRRRALEAARCAWPVALIGLTGCAMYLLVHVESRYTAAFIVLFFCAVLPLLQEVSLKPARSIVAVAVPIFVVYLLYPAVSRTFSAFEAAIHASNDDALAAEQLHRMGVEPGDYLGRISGSREDLSIERIARAEIVDEVDFTRVPEFWSSPVEVQNQVLRALVANGATAVIATKPQLSETDRSDWKRLAASDYWVWVPAGAENAR